MGEIVLLVNGVKYAGWETADIQGGIDQISGQFSLSVSKRFNAQGVKWPIKEGDECAILITSDTPGGAPTKLISGFIDRRNERLSAAGHAVMVSGRDRTADMVDSSTDLDNSEYGGHSVLSICNMVGATHGVTFHYAAGVTPPPAPQMFAIDKGETDFDVVERVCRRAGLLKISNGDGTVTLSRTGTLRTASPIIEGQNGLEFGISGSSDGRYSRYKVYAQKFGSDDDSGDEVSEITATATDPVPRSNRILNIVDAGAIDADYAGKRARWEAAVRAARAETLSVTVKGWTMANGELWPLNYICRVKSPTLGIDTDMLIIARAFSVAEQSGTTVELTLQRKDAYTPAPVVPEVDIVE